MRVLSNLRLWNTGSTRMSREQFCKELVVSQEAVTAACLFPMFQDW